MAKKKSGKSTNKKVKMATKKTVKASGKKKVMMKKAMKKTKGGVAPIVSPKVLTLSTVEANMGVRGKF